MLKVAIAKPPSAPYRSQLLPASPLALYRSASIAYIGGPGMSDGATLFRCW
jgi:hypothetical protein